jgi:hypothetical protein
VWNFVSITRREEHRLRRVLRRIFGRKRDEVAEGWRRLHNEELNNLYASLNIIGVILSRRMIYEMGRICSTNGRHENGTQYFGWKI